MKRIFLILCIIGEFSYAELLEKMPFEFAIAEDKPAATSLTPSPEEIEKTFGAFKPPDAPVVSSNPEIFSVIDSGIEGSDSAVSIGEDFFKSPQTLSGIEEVSEPVYDIPSPTNAWTNEDISGVKEESVEDILSRRGLPRVNSANTSLDILGLPKPNLAPYEIGSTYSESPIREEVKTEKAKARFRDMFNSQ